VLPILFRVTRGEKGLAKSLEELCVMARRMIEEDEINLIILSDRGVTQDYAPVPALLAVAGLHHYLIRECLRTVSAWCWRPPRRAKSTTSRC